MKHLSTEFCENQFISFCVIFLTSKLTRMKTSPNRLGGGNTSNERRVTDAYMMEQSAADRATPASVGRDVPSFGD